MSEAAPEPAAADAPVLCVDDLTGMVLGSIGGEFLVVAAGAPSMRDPEVPMHDVERKT